MSVMTISRLCSGTVYGHKILPSPTVWFFFLETQSTSLFVCVQDHGSSCSSDESDSDGGLGVRRGQRALVQLRVQDAFLRGGDRSKEARRCCTAIDNACFVGTQ